MTHLRPALVMLLLMTLLIGLAYPFFVTGVAHALLSSSSNGMPIERDGVVVGSALIGQGFASPPYLRPRPSASGWNAARTGASNLGPTSAALVADVAARTQKFEMENGAAAPIDAVTASGSGLDPDISPEAASAQVARITTARGMDEARVRAIVEAGVRGPWLGL